MTDPRIAALAEALEKWWATDDAGMPGTGSWERAGGWLHEAAAILAALPPAPALDGQTFTAAEVTQMREDYLRERDGLLAAEATIDTLRAALEREHDARAPHHTVTLNPKCATCRLLNVDRAALTTAKEADHATD